MSIDYFAVRADEISAARAIVEGDIPKNVVQLDKEALARSIEQAVPDFERFQKDWSAIAESEGMTVEEARLQFSSIELNWDRDSYVQVIVDDHVVSIRALTLRSRSRQRGSDLRYTRSGSSFATSSATQSEDSAVSSRRIKRSLYAMRRGVVRAAIRDAEIART